MSDIIYPDAYMGKRFKDCSQEELIDAIHNLWAHNQQLLKENKDLYFKYIGFDK